MNAKRFLALLLALCVFAGGAMSALAEDGDLLGDLLGFITDTSGVEFVEATQAPDDEAEYAYDEALEQAVTEHLTVDDYAITEGLDDEWENILLLGTDSRTVQKYSRTDTMIVLSVNRGTGEAKLTSIMRDSWVEIPGHGGCKLNAACVYGGPELTIQTINRYFDLNIEKYVLVNMICLAEIVDRMGGIRLDVTESERRAMNAIMEDYSSLSDNIPLDTAGSQLLLNGDQALAYARIRKLDSDYKRTERQRTVLTTIAAQLQQESPVTLTVILSGALDYMDTNMDLPEMLLLLPTFARLNVDSISQFRLPAEGAYSSGYYGKVWAIKPNYEKNKQLLHEFIYGD